MPTALVLSLALQQLAVAPYPCEIGGEATVRASAPAGPIAGLAVAVETPDGRVADLGITDAAGELRFQPAQTGMHRVVARHADARLVAPLQVVPVPPRWLYGLLCVPLGLW